MSLNKYLDKLLEELEDLEEISSTGGGEAYDSKYAFSELEDEDVEQAGYKKMKESKFKQFAKIYINFNQCYLITII